MIVKLHTLGEMYRGGWVFLDQKAWSEWKELDPACSLSPWGKDDLSIPIPLDLLWNKEEFLSLFPPPHPHFVPFSLGWSRCNSLPWTILSAGQNKKITPISLLCLKKLGWSRREYSLHLVQYYFRVPETTNFRLGGWILFPHIFENCIQLPLLLYTGYIYIYTNTWKITGCFCYD